MGDVEVVLEFDAFQGLVLREGVRIARVIPLPRDFYWKRWEFSLPELGPAHRFLFEVESILGTILTFRCYLDQVLLFEDRNLGQEIVAGSQFALSDHPIAAQPPGHREGTLPLAAEEDPDDGAVAG